LHICSALHFFHIPLLVTVVRILPLALLTIIVPIHLLIAFLLVVVLMVLQRLTLLQKLTNVLKYPLVIVVELLEELPKTKGFSQGGAK